VVFGEFLLLRIDFAPVASRFKLWDQRLDGISEYMHFILES